MAEQAIRFCDISKHFGEVKASDHVSFSLKKGEILALLGENGSGKTTLMNMLSGIYFPDSGHIEVNGAPVSIRSPKDAFQLGIGMIHQHFKLIPVFTAAENIILGEQGGKYDLRAAEQKLSELADRYGFRLNPKQKVYELSVSEKQTVEIMKVLYRGADILILDEPTAVLTPQETERLFAILRKMREDGKSILIITHKLNEVLAISTRRGASEGAVYRRGRDRKGGCFPSHRDDGRRKGEARHRARGARKRTETPPPRKRVLRECGGGERALEFELKLAGRRDPRHCRHRRKRAEGAPRGQ